MKSSGMDGCWANDPNQLAADAPLFISSVAPFLFICPCCVVDERRRFRNERITADSQLVSLTKIYLTDVLLNATSRKKLLLNNEI